MQPYDGSGKNLGGDASGGRCCSLDSWSKPKAGAAKSSPRPLRSVGYAVPAAFHSIPAGDLRQGAQPMSFSGDGEIRVRLTTRRQRALPAGEGRSDMRYRPSTAAAEGSVCIRGGLAAFAQGHRSRENVSKTVFGFEASFRKDAGTACVALGAAQANRVRRSRRARSRRMPESWPRETARFDGACPEVTRGSARLGLRGLLGVARHHGSKSRDNRRMPLMAVARRPLGRGRRFKSPEGPWCIPPASAPRGDCGCGIIRRRRGSIPRLMVRSAA